MNINGTWTGEYLFDEAACDKQAASVAGHVISFTLELQTGWLGSLSGTVQDDPRTGFPEPGKVKGKFKKNFLEFRRIMPVFRFMHDSGRITLEKWAERRKVVMDTEKPCPPLLFEGTFSDDGNSCEGTWKMPGETLQVPGSYQQLDIPTVGGTWKMKRKP